METPSQKPVASVQETVAIKPRGLDPKRPTTVFLSYKRQNADEVAILERELKLRGVRPWRDVADLQKGRPVEEEIIDAIAHQTDALLIYLTPESLASSFIWEVEIPASLERHDRDHSFSIIPVLRGVTASEVQGLCASRGLRSLKDFNFDTLPDPQVDQAAFNEKRRKVANEVLKAALRLRLRRIQADDDYELSICLYTFKDRPSPPYLDLDLNWYDLFLDRDRLPSQVEWQGTLLPALLDAKDALGELCTSRRLHISLQSILPAAFALGSTFPATTSFTLLPWNKETEEEWSSTGAISLSDPLRRLSYNNEEGDSRVAIVEIAIAQLTAPAVSKTLPLLALSYRHHLQFSLPEGLDYGKGVKDAPHARAIANQIGKELRSLPGKGVSQIHLFAAIPAALAVLIGHQFNAICPVTVYEYSRLDGIYKLACTL